LSEDKYEQFFKACTKMFSRAIDRIIYDRNIKVKKKLELMAKIDEYIDLATEKR